jgi:cytochrome c biogenesis protein CcdA/thiol-disulfide isomerase/thioredoxin
LAAVAGGWAVEANQYGRAAALALLALFGLTLLFPGLADHITQPLVALGARLSRSVEPGAGTQRPAVLQSLLLGVATGLLWAPCAGPVLGLILTGAALQGASVETSLLLLAYAAGAVTSLAAALLVGGRVFAAMKRTLGVGEWVRRGLGVAVLVAVAAIALGLDTGFLTKVSTASTASLEQGLLDSPPLTPDGLKGKVVLIDFWTYSCINCLRAIPYVRAWAEKYKDEGLVVIGVHAPEFAFEKNIKNVRTAISDLKIGYPVAIDNDYAIWRAFNNQYWPAHYFIDAEGRIRHHHFGEGDYAESEMSNVQSPETYVGYDRAENFISPGGVIQDTRHVYAAAALQRNEWALSGDWTIGKEDAVLNQNGGSIVYRFHARDLHLVLGPAGDGKPVRFRVTIDGAPPGDRHGADVDADGQGVVTGQRLYQLIRQRGTIADEIEFLDPGVQAYAFTFG